MNLKKRQRIATFLNSNEDLDRTSYNKSAILGHCANEYKMVNEDYLEFIQDMENKVPDFLDPEAYSEYIKNYEYSSILQRFSRRRDFNDYLSKKSNGCVRFMLYLYEDYLYKSKSSEDKSLQFLFYHIAKFCYRMFIFCVDLTAEHVNITDDIIYYFQTIMSPKFASYVKDLRSYLVRAKISQGTDLELEEYKKALEDYDFVDIPDFGFEDLDRVLNEEYLINWKEECEDFFVTQESIEIPEGSLNIFRSACKELLKTSPESIEIPDYFDILRTISESASLIDYNQYDSKTTRLRVNARKNLKSVIDRDFLKQKANLYKRSLIYVSPANVRDAWIPDFNTRCRLGFFETLFKRIIYDNPRFAICDKKLFDQRVDRIKKHKGFYALVDIKKSGLILPHDLIKIVCEECEQKYDLPFVYLYKCIKNQRILVDNEEYFTKRGMGLGMLNNMFTLINMCVSYIIRTDSIFFSDDSVFTVPSHVLSLESALTFKNNLYKIYEGIGLLMSKKKSIVSLSFVFLEDYYKCEIYNLAYRKTLREFLAVMNSLHSKNYADFKNRIYNYIMNDFLSKEFFRMLAGIIRQLPSEFKDQPFLDDWELKLPPYLGGFGFFSNPDMDYELLVLDEISQKEVNIISNILDRNRMFMDNLVFHEKDKVDISYYIEEENLFDTSQLEKDSILYRSVREISRFEKQMQLNKSLNEISLYSLRRNTRMNNLSRFNFNRSNIKRTISLKNHINRWDLMNDIITFNKDYLGELNFAIPRFIISAEQEIDPCLEPGSLALDMPNVYSNQNRLESILYNKGIMKVKPEVTLVEEFSNTIGNIRRSNFYSFMGKIPQWSEELIQSNKDKWFCFLYLNATPEFAFLDYICRNKAIPICDSIGSDIISEEDYFKRFYSLEDSYILYDLKEEKVEFKSRLIFKKLRRVLKSDPKKCAALVSFYKLKKHRIENFEYAKDSYVRLIERTIDLVEEKTLPLDNENLFDEAFYNFNLSNLVDFYNEDCDATHNPEFINLEDEVEIIPSNIDFSMFNNINDEDISDIEEFDEVPEPVLIRTQPEESTSGGFTFDFDFEDDENDQPEQGEINDELDQDLDQEELDELYEGFTFNFNPDDDLGERSSEEITSSDIESNHSVYYDAYDEAYEDIRALFE